MNYRKGKPEPFSWMKNSAIEERERGGFEHAILVKCKALPSYLFWYLPILNKQVTYSHIRDLYIRGCEDENFTTTHNTQNSTFTLERETWPNFVERESSWNSQMIG